MGQSFRAGPSWPFGPLRVMRTAAFLWICILFLLSVVVSVVVSMGYLQ